MDVSSLIAFADTVQTNMNGYVEVTILVVGALIALFTLVVQQIGIFNQHAHDLTSRLFELDRVTIEHPELQLALINTAKFEGEYFTVARLQDAESIRLKSFVYWQISFIDEIISCFESGTWWPSPLRRVGRRIFEYDDWKAYIFEKLRHPLIKEVAHNEQHIWGQTFRDFLMNNKLELGEPADQKGLY